MRCFFSKIIICCLFLFTYEAQAVTEKKVNFQNEYEHTLSVCCIFHNDAPYLKEWLDYYLLVGVEYFYLYNNLSDDNYLEVLAPYIESGIVELIDWNRSWKTLFQWDAIQCSAYQDAVARANGVTKWLAIVDSDEFIIPVLQSNLPEFLKDYEAFGAVCANWQIYGTSYVSKIPEGCLLTECLVMKAPTCNDQNLFVKSILRPETVSRIYNPHFACFKRGFFQVNSDKEKFQSLRSPHVLVDKIRINHYWSRDEEYFYKVKVKRYEVWNPKILAEIEDLLDLFNSEFDDIILKFTSTLMRPEEVSTSLRRPQPDRLTSTL